MREFDLIARLTAGLPSNPSVLVGPGDDCAVLENVGGDRVLLFKTDAVVEGIHFTSETDPRLVGRKALARCLSDIAAMAGTPTAALITLGLPAEHDPAKLDAVYAGISELASRHQVAIVGGETTTNPGRMLISIALLGWAPRNRVPLRGGARVGDALFVTGTLGGSLPERHLTFDPRLEEARWLAEHFRVGAMIDLSDGLAGDLRHVLLASKVGAELLAAAIPISRQARLAARTSSSAKPALVSALTDGEDFELLFTVPSAEAVPLHDAWRKEFPDLKLSCIGRIVPGAGITLRDKHGSRKLEAHGYVHFQQP
jgi:thiamine-monophosphate kinase